MFGSGHAPERLPAGCAQHDRRLLLLHPLRLHHGQQFAGDERERHERRRQHDARHGEDDLDLMRVQPAAQGAELAQQQHEDQPGDDRRDGEGQVNQRQQEVLAPELELGDGPGGGDAEQDVQRDGDRRRQQGQPDRAERVRVPQRLQVRPPAARERLREDGGQRQAEKEAQKRQCRQDEHQADRPGFRRQPGPLALLRRVGARSSPGVLCHSALNSSPAACGSTIAAG